MATPAAAISRSILNPSQLHLKLYSNYTLFIPISAKDGDNVVNKSDVIRPHHHRFDIEFRGRFIMSHFSKNKI